MPYIPQERRPELHGVSRAPGLRAENAGELNFCITTLILAYLEAYGIHYQTLNEVVGVLECVKQELNRRVIVPYEGTKIEENGDVY